MVHGPHYSILQVLLGVVWAVVNLLLQNAPDITVQWVKVRAVGWPEVRLPVAGQLLVKPDLYRTGHMRWRRVLMKDIRLLPGHSNFSGFDNGFQDLDVVVSGHPEAIGEEVKGHDVPMTSMGATLVTNSGLLITSERRMWIFLSLVKVSGSSQASNCFLIL